MHRLGRSRPETLARATRRRVGWARRFLITCAFLGAILRGLLRLLTSRPSCPDEGCRSRPTETASAAAPEQESTGAWGWSFGHFDKKQAQATKSDARNRLRSVSDYNSNKILDECPARARQHCEFCDNLAPLVRFCLLSTWNGAFGRPCKGAEATDYNSTDEFQSKQTNSERFAQSDWPKKFGEMSNWTYSRLPSPRRWRAPAPSRPPGRHEHACDGPRMAFDVL